MKKAPVVDEMDVFVGCVGVICVMLLYFHFDEEVVYMWVMAKHYWKVTFRLGRKEFRSMEQELEARRGLWISLAGGLAIVGLVHVLRTIPNRAKAKQTQLIRDRIKARRAAVESCKLPDGPEASDVPYAAPEPHFGGDPEQSGVPGTHRTLDPAEHVDRRLTPDDVAKFERDGFLVVRGLLNASELEELRAAMGAIIDEWPLDRGAAPGDAPETPHVAFDPAFLTGQLKVETKAQAVRRIFRMAVHSDYFAAFCRRPHFVDFLRHLWGDDVALLQSMALMKPPKTGEKRWHQDQAYFRLAPSKVAAYWIAVDPTDAENGCMHVVPGSHTRGVRPHGADVGIPPTHPAYTKFNLGGVYYSMLDAPKPEDVVACPLQPGDALFFHGDLVHATPPNTSADRPRAAVQLHYAAATCRPAKCPDDATSTKAQNKIYGPVDANFDCAPETAAGACTEPQFWFYRRAEMIVSGTRHDGCI